MIFFEPPQREAAGSIPIWETAAKCVNKEEKIFVATFIYKNVQLGKWRYVYMCMYTE